MSPCHRRVAPAWGWGSAAPASTGGTDQGQHPQVKTSSPGCSLDAVWQLLGLLRARLVTAGFGPALVLGAERLTSALNPLWSPQHRHQGTPRGYRRPRCHGWRLEARPRLRRPPREAGAGPNAAPPPYRGRARRKFAGWIPAGKQQPDGALIPARRHPPSRVCTAWPLICSGDGFSLRWTSAAGPGRHRSSPAGLSRHRPGQVPASRVAPWGRGCCVAPRPYRCCIMPCSCRGQKDSGCFWGRTGTGSAGMRGVAG